MVILSILNSFLMTAISGLGLIGKSETERDALNKKLAYSLRERPT